MPTYRRSDEEVERDIRILDSERAYEMDVLVQKNISEIEMAKERGRLSIEKAKVTHRAEQRARIWVTCFEIIPKSLLIICSFTLILFKREVPKDWKDYLSNS